MSTTYGAWLGLLLLPAVGCGEMYIDLFTCKNPDLTYIDAKGNPDPCHRDSPACRAAGLDADVKTCVEPVIDPTTIHGENSEACDGQCIPVKPAFWDGPVLVWIGPNIKNAPGCPAGTSPDVQRFTGLTIPNVCSCNCVPPAGSCGLPSTLTASTERCSQPGGTSISFDAPPSWKGDCSSQNPIPASMGAKSLTIAPLTMTEGGCQRDFSQPPTPDDLVWATLVQICDWPVVDACKKRTELVCAPSPAPPPEFLKCVIHEGHQTSCPPGYPVPTLQDVHERDAKVDNRTCLSCACGFPPEGSQCGAQVSVYENNVCGGPPAISNQVKSDNELCIDIATSTALLSKSAEPPVYHPGRCDSGQGEATGDVELSTELTICCMYEKFYPE